VAHDFELTELTGVAVRTAELTGARRRALRLCGTDEPVPTFADVLARVAGRAPLLVELKRPRPGPDSHLVSAVLAELRSYRGEYALASFDPLVVWALRRSRPGAPVGQISGLLRRADPVSRIVGRSLLTNRVTRPDFVSYELAGLPSPAVTRARAGGLPVLAWPVTSPEEEATARRYADNVIFSGYLPPLPPEGTAA
jgi:glycerophosphoryl diester phosphodiesterase